MLSTLYGQMLDASLDGAFSTFTSGLISWTLTALLLAAIFAFFVMVFVTGQRARQNNDATLDATLDGLDGLDGWEASDYSPYPTPSGRRRLVTPAITPVIVPLAGVLDGGALPASQVAFMRSVGLSRQGDDSQDIQDSQDILDNQGITDETPDDSDDDEQPTQVTPAVRSVARPVAQRVIQGPFGVLVADRVGPLTGDALN